VLIMPHAYVAGPLFDEGERRWIETVERTVAAAGFETFLPHRDNPEKTAHTVELIYANDKAGIDRCDVVVANLNGITTDDGTAWELGYAFGTGKYLIGLHTDWRRRFDDEVVNLMIECSLDVMVHSLEDVVATLADWRSAQSG
jgi:nucleoside 2-deoxyribosyltransferase